MLTNLISRQPLIQELDFWTTEKENLAAQLAQMKVKEQELQKNSFEALVLPMSTIRVQRAVGTAGYACQLFASSLIFPLQSSAAKVYEGLIRVKLEGGKQVETLVVLYVFERINQVCMLRQISCCLHNVLKLWRRAGDGAAGGSGPAGAHAIPQQEPLACGTSGCHGVSRPA
jgi:hypothetical protein